MSTWSAGMVATLVTSTPPGAEVLVERVVARSARTATGSSPAARSVACDLLRSPQCLPARGRAHRPVPSAMSRWPSQSSRTTGKSSRQWQPRVSSRVDAAADERRGDGDQVGRLPARRLGVGPGRGELGERARGPRERRGAAQHAGPAGHRPSAAPAGRPGSTTHRSPSAVGAGSACSGRSGRDVLRRSAGRRPAPPAASCWRSRLAPCTPVQATSPQAYRPGIDVRPCRSVRTPPLA